MTATLAVENYPFNGTYAQIPERMQAALLRWVVEGKRPGDFLWAVLQNDLRNAVFRADDENLPLLPLYVRWLYNVAPAECHGSLEMVMKWANSPKRLAEQHER